MVLEKIRKFQKSGEFSVKKQQYRLEYKRVNSGEIMHKRYATLNTDVLNPYCGIAYDTSAITFSTVYTFVSFPVRYCCFFY